MSAYDKIARLYDPWSRSVVEDVAVLRRGGGALRRPGARARRRHGPDRGADRRRGHPRRRRRPLRGDARGRARAAPSSPASSVDLRHGDMRDPPVEGDVPARDLPVPLAAAHGDRRRPARGAARGRGACSRRAGASSSTSSRPARTTSPRRTAAGSSASPGIWERADWDEETRTLILRVRGEAGESEMSLAWLVGAASGRRCSARRASSSTRVYGWFDRTPWRGGEDSIWVCRAPRFDTAGSAIAARARRGERPRRTFSDSAPAIGIVASTSRSTSAGSPSRSAPSRNATRPDRSTDDERLAAVRDERDPSCSSDCYVPRSERHAPDRAGARAQRLRRRRVGAAVRERDRRRRTRRRCGSACRRCRGRRAATARASRRAPPSAGRSARR